MESVNGKHSVIYEVSLSGIVRKGKEGRNKEGEEEVQEQATSVGKQRLSIARRERGRKEQTIWRNVWKFLVFKHVHSL